MESDVCMACRGKLGRISSAVWGLWWRYWPAGMIARTWICTQSTIYISERQSSGMPFQRLTERGLRQWCKVSAYASCVVVCPCNLWALTLRYDRYFLSRLQVLQRVLATQDFHCITNYSGQQFHSCQPACPTRRRICNYVSIWISFWLQSWIQLRWEHQLRIGFMGGNWSTGKSMYLYRWQCENWCFRIWTACPGRRETVQQRRRGSGTKKEEKA